MADLNDSVVFRKNQDIIENSSNSDFFNSSIKNILSISEGNEENPPKLDIETSAFIEGTVQELEEDAAKNVSKVLVTFKDELVNKAKDDAAALSLQNAKNNSITNIIESKNIASYVNRKNYYSDRMKAFVSQKHIKDVEDAVKEGTLKQKDAVDLLNDFSRQSVVYFLGDILRDNELDVESKHEFVSRFLDGKTGIKVVDEWSVSNRYKAVQDLINMVESIEEFTSKQDKTNEKLAESNWNKLAVEYAVKKSQNLDSLELSEMEQRLKATATNLNQLAELNNISKYSEKETDADTRAALDILLNRGALTEEVLDDFARSGNLNITDYGKYLEKLQQPLQQNLTTDAARLAILNAERIYNYNPEDQEPNSAMLNFRYEFNKALAGKLLNSDDINKAASDALEKTNRLYPDKISEVAKKEKFADEHNGIGYDSFAKKIGEIEGEIASSKTQKQRLSGLNELEKADAKVKAARSLYIEKGLNPTDGQINTLINDYNKMSE